MRENRQSARNEKFVELMTYYDICIEVIDKTKRGYQNESMIGKCKINKRNDVIGHENGEILEKLKKKGMKKKEGNK